MATVQECPICLRVDCAGLHVECSPVHPRSSDEARLVRELRGLPPLPPVTVCECGEQMVEPAARCGFCVAEELDAAMAA